MYHGSCLCGQIKLEVRGPIESIIHCHCSKCRKSSGTAYATNGFVSAEDLVVTVGEEFMTSYETSPGKRRHFCKVCASPVFSSNELVPGKVRVRLGILESDIIERPISHNFVSSRANWDDLDANLPRYDGHEPSRGANK